MHQFMVYDVAVDGSSENSVKWPTLTQQSISTLTQLENTYEMNITCRHFAR